MFAYDDHAYACVYVSTCLWCVFVYRCVVVYILYVFVYMLSTHISFPETSPEPFQASASSPLMCILLQFLCIPYSSVMVVGPHRGTQARMLSKVKVQNESGNTKRLQRSLIQWVMDNPNKAEAMNDIITNGQLDMYINGEVSDNMGSKPILRRCNSWGKISLHDIKKVLFSGKHMPSAVAKKVAKSTEQKERLWVFMSARKKNESLAPNMTHSELWQLMDTRITAVGPRQQSVIVEHDKIVYEKCGPWDTTQKTPQGLQLVCHRYLANLKAHALDHLFEPCYFLHVNYVTLSIILNHVILFSI